MLEYNHKNTGFLHLCYFSCLSSCGIRGGTWALLNTPLGTSRPFPFPSHWAGEVTNPTIPHLVSLPCCASHPAPHRRLCRHSCSTELCPPPCWHPQGHSTHQNLCLICSAPSGRPQCCSWLFTTTPSIGKNPPCQVHLQPLAMYPKFHITHQEHFCSNLPVLPSQRRQQGIALGLQTRGVRAHRWEIFLPLSKPAPSLNCFTSHRAI